MSQLVWEATPPELRSPIMVTAFRGWFDVGGAATGAVEQLTEGNRSVRVAHIDPEEFFVFSEQRPRAVLVEGRREIVWPRIEVHALRAEGAGRDLVLVAGAEPQLRWRTFVETVVEVAERSGTALLITLGAQVAEVPHTRPFSVTGSAADPDLAGALGLSRPSYQGPTGVVGVLHDVFGQIEVSAVSLWAAVPHYVSGAPNPKASRALLERFERVTGMPTGWADLDGAARRWEDRVNEAMLENDEVVAYVRRLEAKADERAARQAPSGEDLAAEFERFLRQQRDGA